MKLEKRFLKELARRKRRQRRQAVLKSLKSIKPIYWVGLALLAFVLMYQFNPSRGLDPTDQFLTRFVYRPAPPEQASPWPWQNQLALHPAVVDMPADVETNINGVAQYIAQQESDPNLQVKAIHDYVISRVNYDLSVLETGVRPSQDARTVFETHQAVCEGYAHLFNALGQAMGMEVMYLEGDIRKDLAPLDLIPSSLRLIQSQYNWTRHAWNAVKVEGHWQLVDTTWDDSTLADAGETYHADYLMLPPKALIMSHLPDNPDWQLLSETTIHRDFENSPLLTPQFFSQGLVLNDPIQYQTTVAQSASITLQGASAYGDEILGFFSKRQDGMPWLPELATVFSARESEADLQFELCQTQPQDVGTIQIICEFPEPGDYQVLMFALSDAAHPLGQLKFRSQA